MSNTSYCRFRSTLEDLRECYENMDDDDISEDEADARKQLIRLCVTIANNYTGASEHPDLDRFHGARPIGY